MLRIFFPWKAFDTVQFDCFPSKKRNFKKNPLISMNCMMIIDVFLVFSILKGNYLFWCLIRLSYCLFTRKIFCTAACLRNKSWNDSWPSNRAANIARASMSIDIILKDNIKLPNVVRKFGCNQNLLPTNFKNTNIHQCREDVFP